MRKCGRAGESWGDSKLWMRWTYFVPCYNSYLIPWLAPSLSAFFPFFSRQTSLLVTAQAGLIGDCILKVTLGKNAGIAALPLSGCFVSVADCVEAPKQAWSASRAASVPACLLSQRACDSQERKVWIRRLLYFEWLSTQWISTSS